MAAAALVQAPSAADELMETSPAQVTQKAKRVPSKTGRGKAAPPSMAGELTELQGMLERLRLEKEKAEEMVRERDEVIRKKEEEIETKGKQQERLQAELNKMQRIKEFKPTMSSLCLATTRKEMTRAIRRRERVTSSTRTRGVPLRMCQRFVPNDKIESVTHSSGRLRHRQCSHWNFSIGPESKDAIRDPILDEGYANSIGGANSFTIWGCIQGMKSEITMACNAGLDDGSGFCRRK